MPKLGVMDYYYNAPGVRDEMRLRKNRDWGLNDETLKNGANTIDAIFLTFISLLTLAARQGNYIVPKYDRRTHTSPIKRIKPPDIFKDLKVRKRRTGKRLHDTLGNIPITVNFITDITQYDLNNTFICPVSALSKTPISQLGNIQTLQSGVMGFLTGLVSTWGDSWENPAGHSGFIIFELKGNFEHIGVNYTTHGLLAAGKEAIPFSTLFPHNRFGVISDHDTVIQTALIRCIEMGEVGTNIYLHDVSKILAPMGNKLKGNQLEGLIYYSCYLNGIESIKHNHFYKGTLDHFMSNNSEDLSSCENNQVSYSHKLTALREIPLCPKEVNCMYFVSLVVGSSASFLSGMTRSRLKALQSKIYGERTANIEEGRYADEVFGIDYQKLFGLTEKEGEGDYSPSPKNDSEIRKKFNNFARSMGKIASFVGVGLLAQYAYTSAFGMSKKKKGKKKNPKTGKKKKGKKKNPKTGKKKRV